MQALRFLLSRWVLSFVGIAILAVLVWLFGPLIPSFEALDARIRSAVAARRVRKSNRPAQTPWEPPSTHIWESRTRTAC